MELLFPRRQAPVSMRVGAWLARAQLAFFSHFGATSGAANCEGFFVIGFHTCMMHRSQATRCSIVTSPHGRTRTSFIASELSCSDTKVHTCHSVVLLSVSRERRLPVRSSQFLA